MNNAQVHALLHVALQEGWSVEKFLEQAVLTLGQLSAAITTECIRLQMLVPPPPIVVDGKTYRFMNPEELDGRQPDPPGPVRS
jgi:hypothetical protein